jgi:hypothetical protein
MKTLIFVLVIFCCVIAERDWPGTGDHLKFVFELVSHGARSPAYRGPGFNVPKGQLTREGMR